MLQFFNGIYDLITYFFFDYYFTWPGNKGAIGILGTLGILAILGIFGIVELFF